MFYYFSNLKLIVTYLCYHQISNLCTVINGRSECFLSIKFCQIVINQVADPNLFIL